MFSNVLAVGLLATSALALDAMSPVHQFGAMLARDSLEARQGYYPTTHYCGRGDTCEVACGADYRQCPSKSGLYCFEPSAGDTCCPDNSGNSCDKGYYCTSDPKGATYCCPNGSDLVSCAKAYSLTVALVSQTGSASIPPPSSVVLPSTTASTTPIHVTISSSGAVSATTKTTASLSFSTPINPTGSKNGTISTAAPSQFTGAAVVNNLGPAMAVLGGAVAVAGIL